MNNPKRILKINSIYKSIKKNKLLWDKFNHERKRRLHWKPTKHYFKKLKGTWTNGKTLHVHGLKDLMLLRWRYYIEEAIDPVPSLSKSLWCVLFVCFAVVVVVVYQNRKTHPKNPTQLTFVPAVSPARHALTPVSPASEKNVTLGHMSPVFSWWPSLTTLAFPITYYLSYFSSLLWISSAQAVYSTHLFSDFCFWISMVQGHGFLSVCSLYSEHQEHVRHVVDAQDRYLLSTRMNRKHTRKRNTLVSTVFFCKEARPVKQVTTSEISLSCFL